jgi:hypothetical protein
MIIIIIINETTDDTQYKYDARTAYNNSSNSVQYGTCMFGGATCVQTHTHTQGDRINNATIVRHLRSN